ncbi:CopG family transcriptional regulator [Aquibium sp. ELW1220]|uniref:CopG family transcriptional regulator n=1 Tax=Aquibium sp. ELW1220 TaxID=2976766 RepID=UPI0025B07D63|nr:CopG family transcriptional regulator [Aquibium sp. ELW1220]MDN2581275.1 CopG family transcriptional regulator [Aquibium sp. ELW1220]
MRTTLEIDDDVLEAAKRIANAERRSAGQVLSDLARRSLEDAPVLRDRQAIATTERNGWIILPDRPGRVTADRVEQLLLESDLSDALQD